MHGLKYIVAFVILIVLILFRFKVILNIYKVKQKRSLLLQKNLVTVVYYNLYNYLLDISHFVKF